jgi:aspartyl-tRNA synthetase
MENLNDSVEKLEIGKEEKAATLASESGSAAPSKNALKKAAKEADKAKKKQEAAQAKASAQKAAAQQEEIDTSEGKYGVLPLIQSTSRTGTIRPREIVLALMQ